MRIDPISEEYKNAVLLYVCPMCGYTYTEKDEAMECCEGED